MEGPLRKIAICAPTLASALGILLIAAGARQTPGDQKSETTAPRQQDWPVYGGSPENTRYTTLAEINRENVKQLAVAWSYDTGEEGGLQTSPLRSEEHTSELQSRLHLVCRLLLEKKNHAPAYRTTPLSPPTPSAPSSL